MKRARAAIAAALLGLVLIAIMLLDADRRRHARDARRNDAVVELVGTADLALSSSARWLRHPSQAEAGAAFADLPASLDADPAGAWIGPPIEIVAGAEAGR